MFHQFFRLRTAIRGGAVSSASHFQQYLDRLGDQLRRGIRVEFGLSRFALVDVANGSSIPNVGSSIIHQTKLTGLQPETRYYYRVKTGNAVSEVFDFKSPANSNSGYPLRFALIPIRKSTEPIPTSIMRSLTRELSGT